MNRRKFLSITAGGAALGFAMSNPLTNMAMAASAKPNIKAIAFDGFPIFDPRPVFGLVKTLFPEKGEALGKLWFTKIFGYTWLRTLGNQYKGFHEIIEDALVFSAHSLDLDLTPDKKAQLTDIWLNLKAWPDVEPALRQFQKQNIRLGFLSNLSEDMLRTNARNSGLEDIFEFYLSTDRVQAYKPDPRAYQMGVEAFGLPKHNIAFAAFAGWDAAGANWFGYPTLWVNRLGFPAENLGENTIVTGKNMMGLAAFVKRPDLKRKDK